MAQERRYGDEEVREIFERATTSGDRRLPLVGDPEGLTLGDLQEIGKEVGVTPEAVARAASEVAPRGERSPTRTALGAPVSVGRTVELPRAPTEREWEILVAELRSTFQAKGQLSGHGNLREWTNGNLHAFIEPSRTGYRLRLGTLKRSASALNALGILSLLMSGLNFISILGGEEATVLLPAFLGVLGVSTLIGGRLQLRRWAREREAQMRHIAEHATRLLGVPPHGEDPGP